MVKRKILVKIRNNINLAVKRFQNERVQDQLLQILSLLSGIGIALVLNSILPLPFIVLIFYFNLAIVFALVVLAWLTEYFVLIRILLIGASIVSVLSALLTWISIGKTGIIQIDINQIDGLFRSILLTSFF